MTNQVENPVINQDILAEEAKTQAKAQQSYPGDFRSALMKNVEQAKYIAQSWGASTDPVTNSGEESDSTKAIDASSIKMRLPKDVLCNVSGERSQAILLLDNHGNVLLGEVLQYIYNILVYNGEGGVTHADDSLILGYGIGSDMRIVGKMNMWFGSNVETCAQGLLKQVIKAQEKSGDKPVENQGPATYENQTGVDSDKNDQQPSPTSELCNDPAESGSELGLGHNDPAYASTEAVA